MILYAVSVVIVRPQRKEGGRFLGRLPVLLQTVKDSFRSEFTQNFAIEA